jgi:hypothetical protein
MERGKSKGFDNSMRFAVSATSAAATGGGITNAIEVTAERSVSWQQDMEQAIMPDMSWPQSM